MMLSLARRIDIGLQNFYASLKKIRFLDSEEMQPAFACALLRRDLFQNTNRRALKLPSCDPRGFSKLFWVGEEGETLAYTDPHLCRAGFLRMELAHRQRDSQTTS